MIVPLTTIGLSSVLPQETASAAGIANFGRTLAGAVATAIMTTVWSDMSRARSDELSGTLNGSQATSEMLQQQGFTVEQARVAIAQMVESQGTAVATGELFVVSAIALFLAATTIWLAPRPPKNVKPADGH